MCSIGSIRLFLQAFNWVKAGFSLYVFAIGCFLASSSDMQQAFGVEFISHGISLIFISILSLAMIYPFKFGVDKHNRCVIMFIFVMETIVFAELINYSIILRSYTFSEFPKALQSDCLRNVPQTYSAEQCAAFYNSDRTAGFRLFWESYFTKIEAKQAYQVLTTIGKRLCCGFFQPFRCTPNPDQFPSNRATKGIDSKFLVSRVQCSTFKNYYQSQDNCQDVYDYSTDPPTIGGCVYDLGAGSCLRNKYEPETIGCASFVEDYVVALVAPHAIAILIAAMLNFLCMVLACCMWWKRKETDIFPEFLSGNKVNAATIKTRLFQHTYLCC
jgi:hypothetical protein